MADEVAALQAELARVGVVTSQLAGIAQGGDQERFLANAAAYLEMLGHIVVAWIWLQQALVATRAMATAGAADRPFYDGKLRACRYFFRYELPKTVRLAELLLLNDDTCLTMSRDAF